MRILLALALSLSMAAALEDSALSRLHNEREQALATLQQLRESIQEQRRSASAAVEAQVEQLRRLRQQRQAAATEAQQLQGELSSQQTAAQADQQRWQGLQRQLVSHGLLPDPAADPATLIANAEDGLRTRLQDLQYSIRLRMDEATVFDRQGQRHENLPVLKWGQAQMVALGDTPATRGFCTRGSDGTWLINGPHLASDHDHGYPLDVSGRLASNPPLPQGLAAFIERGGPFVWPIFAIAIVALVTAVGRLLLRLSWRRPQGSARALIAMSDAGAALTQARRWRGPVGVLLAGILSAPPGQRNELAGAALAEAEVSIARSLRLLAVLAAAAPLLGLLGTVTGMIASFQALGAEAGADAERLSAGIGQALLTTELGLMVAVPTLIIHALFARDASRLRSRCEAEALRLIAALDEWHRQPEPQQ